MTGAHELGHVGGLRHQNDEKNTIQMDSNNLMYSDPCSQDGDAINLNQLQSIEQKLPEKKESNEKEKNNTN